MSFGGGATVAAARVVLGVDAGQFSEGLRSAEAQWASAMGEMGGATAELAERQLRAAAAAERLDMAIKQGAAGTVRATEATAALVREQRKLVDVQLEADAAATKFGKGVSSNSGHVSNYGRALGFTTSALIGGAGLVYGIKLAVDASQKFQQQMVLIQTQALKSRGEVERMTKAVLHLAGPLATAPTELSKGLYHVESSGYSAAKAVQVLTTATKGARIGQSDLESTTNALVAAMRTGIRGTHDMRTAMSTLDAIVGAGNMRMNDLAQALASGVVPAAKQFGLSLSELGGALDTLTIKGVPAELAATRLRYTIALLGASTPKAAKQLESIGIADGKVAHIMRTQGLVPALELLNSKLKTSGKTIEAQNEILVRAYGGGRSSTTILTLIQNLRELQMRTQKIEEQGTASKFAARWKEQTQTAAFAFDQLRAIVSKTAIELGDALLPGTVKSAQAISTWLEKANSQHRLQNDLRQGFNDVTTAADEFGHVLHDIAEGFHIVDEAVPGNLLKLLLEGFLLFKAAKIARGFTTAFVDPMKEMVKQTKTAQKELGTLETEMATRGGGRSLPGSVLPMRSLRPDVAGGAPLATESAAFDKVSVAVGKQAAALRSLDGVIDDQGGFLDSQVAATQTTVDDTAAREANAAAVKDQIAAYDRYMTQMASRAAVQDEQFGQDTTVGTRGPGGVLIRGRSQGNTVPLYSASPAGTGEFGNPFALNVSPAARAQVSQVAPAMPLPMAFAITPAQTQMIADRWNPVFQKGYRTKEKPSMTAGDVQDLQRKLSGMSPAAQQSIIGALASGEGWTIGELDGLSAGDLQQLEKINPDIAQAVRLQRVKQISGTTTSLRGGAYTAPGGPGLVPGPISDQYMRQPGTSFGGDRYFRRMPDGSLVRVGAEEYFGRYARTNERAAAPTAEQQAAQASGIEAERAANQERIQAHEAALRAARQQLSTARGALSAMPVPAEPPVGPAEMQALEQAAGRSINARQRFDEELTRRRVYDDLSNMRPEEAATRRRLQRAVRASGYMLSDAQTRNYEARQASLPYGVAQSNVEQAQAEVERRQTMLEAARQEGIRLAQAQARTLSQTPVEPRSYTPTPVRPFPGYQEVLGATAGYSGYAPMSAGGVTGGRVPPGYEVVAGTGGASMLMPAGSGYPRQFQGEPTLAEKAALREEAAAAQRNLEEAQARAAELRQQAEAARAQADEADRMAASQRDVLGGYAQAAAKNQLREQELTPLQQRVKALTAELQAARGKTSAAYVEEQPAEPGTGVPARPAGWVKRTDRYPRFATGQNVGGVEEARIAGTNRIVPIMGGKPATREQVVQYLRKQRAEAQAAVREYEAANPKLAEGFPQGIVGQTREAQITAARVGQSAAEIEAQAKAAEEAVKPVEDIAAAWQGVVDRIGTADDQLNILAARMKVIAGVNLARSEAASIPVGAAQGKIASTPGDVLAELTGSGAVPRRAAPSLPAVALSKEAKQAILDRAGYVGNTATYRDEYTKLAQSAGLAQKPLQSLVETEAALGRETKVAAEALAAEGSSMQRLGSATARTTGALSVEEKRAGVTSRMTSQEARAQIFQQRAAGAQISPQLMSRMYGVNWDQLMVAQKEYQTQIAAITNETGQIVEGLGVTEEDLVKLRSELASINEQIARVEEGIAMEAKVTPAFTGARRGIGPGGVVSRDAAAMAAEEKGMMASSAAMLASMRGQMKAARAAMAESRVMSRVGGLGRGMGMNQAMGLGMLMTMFGGQMPGIGSMMSGAGMGMMFAPMLGEGVSPWGGALIGGALGARTLIRRHVHGTFGGFAGNIGAGAMAGAGLGLMGGPFAELTVPAGAAIGAGVAAAATGLSMLFHSSDATSKALMGLAGAASHAQRGVSGARVLLQNAQAAKANDKYNLDQAKSAWEAAKAEEKATRGTRDHGVAVDKLNAAYQNYKTQQRLVKADIQAEDRARKQITNDTKAATTANKQLAAGIETVAHSIRTEAYQWAYGTTQAQKAAFRVQQFSSRMNDLADKAQKTNPKLAKTYRELARIAKETRNIPSKAFIDVYVRLHLTGAKIDKAIQKEMGSPHNLLGQAADAQKKAAAKKAKDAKDAKKAPPYVDPSSSSYLSHLNSQIAQIQAGLMKGNVKKLEEEELAWLRRDYRRAKTDAEKQAIAEAISALKSQMASQQKPKKAQGDSLIPQSLQDQYNRAYQHHNKKGELEALEKEKKLLQQIAAHSHGARHHKAEQELNAVVRQIAALTHTSAAGSSGFLSGKQMKEWIKLENRYAKAQQTPGTKDDIAALKAEQAFLQRVRDHLHGKAQLEANKLLAQIDKKLQKLVELQQQTIKDLEQTYLSDLASFFAAFGSNVFTGQKGQYSPGSGGPTTGGGADGGGDVTGPPPSYPAPGPPGPPVASAPRAAGKSGGGVTVINNQYFPPGSQDAHDRHAAYARSALQSAFD